jgi:hypothetical protein
MYRLSHGGEDPIASEASRELFEQGLVEEVKWLDWQTYCRTVLNRLPEEPGDFWHGLRSLKQESRRPKASGFFVKGTFDKGFGRVILCCL